jgi:CheY-like chemotaxis protein
MRILIVDDHEVSRAAISALLQTEGFHVADVAPGRAAIAVAMTFCPAVAVVDVSPDRATGFGVASQLRALPDAPIVLLTSSAGRRRFGARLDQHQFIAKADLCGEAITALLQAPASACRAVPPRCASSS